MLVFMLSDTKLVCFVKCIVIRQQVCAFRWCHILFCIFQAPTSFPIAGLDGQNNALGNILHISFVLQKQKRKSRKGRGGGNIGGPDFLDSPVGH